MNMDQEKNWEITFTKRKGVHVVYGHFCFDNQEILKYFLSGLTALLPLLEEKQTEKNDEIQQPKPTTPR